MKKIIAFARVSTVKQDLEQHKEVLKNEATRLGYTEENIIYIGEKESGKTLEEEERLTIQSMWEHIDSDPEIDCVICFEVSRIARKPKICFSVRDQLQQRHIQLIILNPYTKCFETDWSLNQGAGLVFAIFAQLAESEANLFKERSKRGKAKSAELGKYSGGPIRYGYKPDANGVLQIDPEEAENVRLVFRLRAENKYTPAQIFHELQQRGITISFGKICKMIKDEAYTGVTMKGMHCVHLRTLPAIITKEEFLAAMEVTELCKRTRQKTERVRLLSKIFYCEECGNLLTPSAQKGKEFYSCAVHKNHKKYLVKQCDNACQIWVEFIEDFIWTLTRFYHKASVILNKGKNIKGLREENKVLGQKIKAAETSINKYENSLSKAQSLYVMGDWTEKQYKAFRSEKKSEIEELKKNTEQWQLKIQRNSELIDSYLEGRNLTSDEAQNVIDEIERTNDRQRMSDLVHQYVQKVTMSYYRNTHNKHIKVYFTDSSVEEYVITNRKNEIFRCAMKVADTEVKDDGILVPFALPEI